MSLGLEFEFVPLNIYDMGADRSILATLGPIKKIPVLQNGDVILSDSKLIYHYLMNLKSAQSFDLESEKMLLTIDAANDAFVNLVLPKRSGIDVSEDKMYFNLQRERISDTLKFLNQACLDGKFEDWNYCAICLYCLVDWIDFRELHDLAPFEGLLSFKQNAAKRADVIDTDPRKFV